MITQIKEFLRGEKSSTDSYVYHDSTLQESIQEWFKTGKANKGKRIPPDATIRQAMLAEDEVELSIRGKHWLSIHETSSELNYKNGKLSELREKPSEFVESEKKTIPDKRYERIDKLHAKLLKMESQYKEQKQFKSQLNNQDNEGQN